MQEEKSESQKMADNEMEILGTIYENIPMTAKDIQHTPIDLDGTSKVEEVQQTLSSRDSCSSIRYGDSFSDSLSFDSDFSRSTAGSTYGVDFDTETESTRYTNSTNRSCPKHGSKVSASKSSNAKRSRRQASPSLGRRVSEDLDNMIKETPKQEHRRLTNFLDMLLIDMEAFEEARIAKHKPLYKDFFSKKTTALSFPVVIKKVAELGPSSLYIEWDCFDSSGIDHLEVEIDGVPVPNTFSPKRNSGVIFDMDVNQKHRVTLMAKPKKNTSRDIDIECNELMDQFGVPRRRRHDVFNEYQNILKSIESWTPSQFFYNPKHSRSHLD